MNIPLSFIQHKQKQISQNQQILTYQPIKIKIKQKEPKQNKKIINAIQTQLNHYINPRKIIQISENQSDDQYYQNHQFRLYKLNRLLHNQDQDQIYKIRKQQTKQNRKKEAKRRKKQEKRMLMGKNKNSLNQSNYNSNQFVQLSSESQNQVKMKKLPKITYLDKNQVIHANFNEKITNNSSKLKNKYIDIQKQSKQLQRILGFNPRQQQNYQSMLQKFNYKFNLNWWNINKDQQNEQNVKKQQHIEKNRNQIPEQEKHQLKKRLKGLRRHKLLGNKYTPLIQFMSNSILVKNYALREKGYGQQSSESQDQMQRYNDYDKRVPTNVLNQQIKQGFYTAQEYNNNNKVDFGIIQKQNRNAQVILEPKLKRALEKLKLKNWIEDQIYTRGLQQDAPIRIQQFQNQD